MAPQNKAWKARKGTGLVESSLLQNPSDHEEAEAKQEQDSQSGGGEREQKSFKALEGGGTLPAEVPGNIPGTPWKGSGKARPPGHGGTHRPRHSLPGAGVGAIRCYTTSEINLA